MWKADSVDCAQSVGLETPLAFLSVSTVSAESPLHSRVPSVTPVYVSHADLEQRLLQMVPHAPCAWVTYVHRTGSLETIFVQLAR